MHCWFDSSLVIRVGIKEFGLTDISNCYQVIMRQQLDGGTEHKTSVCGDFNIREGQKLTIVSTF